MTERRENQRDRILALLQAAGARGVTNLVLTHVCLRYGSRIWELRKEYDIKTIAESESVYRFVLLGKRQPIQLKLIA